MLDKSSRDDWNQWRASLSAALDLSGANLHGKELVDRNLRDADLKCADLSDAILGDANLKHADLRGADLRRATFDNANLSGASLREANLQGVDLSIAQRGLQTEQLAGADLTGATLPEELKKLYDSLENVNNISESARKLFLAVLAACLYSWLAIATTKDVSLITNRDSSPLPIIQTSIPIVGFYWVAPLLLLCVYFYFHFYLQKLWEELGSLPAILPDGRPLHAKIDPWLLNDLVRAHLPKLNINRPFLSYLQLWISVLLAWWVVPITMFLFWERYLPRQERTGTTFHVALLVVSLTAALCLYRLAVATLRGSKRKPFRWRGILTSRRGYQTTSFAVAVGVLFGVVSWGARWGVPSNVFTPDVFRIGHIEVSARPTFLVPRLMDLVGYSPFADLTGAEVSQKKSTWSKNDRDLDSVAGAQLKAAHLRYALADDAFLEGANLDEADLRGASLTSADLQGASLSGASLRGADLSGADLRSTQMESTALTFHFVAGGKDIIVPENGTDLTGADLRGADLRGAFLYGANLSAALLEGANLTYTDFRVPKALAPQELSGLPDELRIGHLSIETVRNTLHWEMAFYDPETLAALGLPSDHNDKLDAQQKEEQRLQQKSSTRQTAPMSFALKRN